MSTEHVEIVSVYTNKTYTKYTGTKGVYIHDIYTKSTCIWDICFTKDIYIRALYYVIGLLNNTTTDAISIS